MRFTKEQTVAFLSLARATSAQCPQVQANPSVDLSWHPPAANKVNNLQNAIHGTGTYGFIFNSSTDPAGTPYGTYNWCNMPHVRKQEYRCPPPEYKLQYVELIHRHHKRTPYAANTFPKEGYSWDCSDEGLFFYGKPLPTGTAHEAADLYWKVYTSPQNPFPPQGFNGTCQFPQITRGGLDDSWQHGKDLFEVYGPYLGFIPTSWNPDAAKKVEYRVTNNVITSQVAGMVVNAMYNVDSDFGVKIQPDSIDSLEPTYTCPDASAQSSSYGVGSTNSNWTAHLTASQDLFNTLDSISGVPSDDSAFHVSYDHYFDNLSSRLCHAKPLPCNISNPHLCVTQPEANEVFRLGELEYSFLYRDAPQSLAASVASYGVWVAELAAHLRDSVAGKSPVVYRHNVAHDGSVSRLLSILQINEMVWPGMGSEVVFELYKNTKCNSHSIRILWGGQVLQSSNPTLGTVDMLDLNVFLAYIDGLVGVNANKIPTLCNQ